MGPLDFFGSDFFVSDVEVEDESADVVLDVFLVEVDESVDDDVPRESLR